MRYYYDGTASDESEEGEDAHRADDGTLHQDDGDESGDTTGASYDEEDDDGLEVDFPRGDGTADTSAVAYCPYCGELNELAVDPGGGSLQLYVEDCHVCCRPWRVTVAFDHDGQAAATLEAADE
jgi:hypothetical protein